MYIYTVTYDRARLQCFRDNTVFSLSYSRFTIWQVILLFFTEVELICKVVLVSHVQQSDSDIHIFFLIFSLVYYRILEYIALCNTIGSCGLLIPYSFHLLVPNFPPNSPLPFFPLGNSKSVLYVCELKRTTLKETN